MRCWHAIAIMLLSACSIQVGDLGPYWNRAKVDPQLAGSWITADPKSPDKIDFVNNGDAYKLTGAEKDLNGRAPLIKSIDIGQYRFLMFGPEQAYSVKHPLEGMLTRYYVSGNDLHNCDIRLDAVKQFLTKRYPVAAREIRFTDCGDPDSADKSCDSHMQIPELNASTLSMLASIPDDKSHWQCQEVAKRLQAQKR